MDAGDGDALERLGRYVTRPALATGTVTLRADGRVEIATLPDLKTGAKGVVLDVLDFVHAVVTRMRSRFATDTYHLASHRASVAGPLCPRASAGDGPTAERMLRLLLHQGRFDGFLADDSTGSMRTI